MGAGTGAVGGAPAGVMAGVMAAAVAGTPAPFWICNIGMAEGVSCFALITCIAVKMSASVSCVVASWAASSLHVGLLALRLIFATFVLGKNGAVDSPPAARFSAVPPSNIMSLLVFCGATIKQLSVNPGVNHSSMV